MDLEELRKAMRRANVAILVTASVLFPAGFLLRNAGEAVLQGLEVACFFGALAIFAIIQTRAERRDERRDQ